MVQFWFVWQIFRDRISDQQNNFRWVMTFTPQMIRSRFSGCGWVSAERQAMISCGTRRASLVWKPQPFFQACAPLSHLVAGPRGAWPAPLDSAIRSSGGGQQTSLAWGKYNLYRVWWASQVALVIKNLPTHAGDIRDSGLIPGSGRSPGRGHGNPLQYSCLENPHGQRNLVGYSL